MNNLFPQYEVRARASLEKRALTDAEKEKGYIGVIAGRIPYMADSHPMQRRDRSRPFIERFAPGAFDQSLAEDRDIMVNAGHTENPLSLLARVGENLEIRSDAEAMRYEALVPDTQAGRDTLRLVDMGILTGTSFEFQVRGSSGELWERRDSSFDQRTISSAKLHALNPVIWPAYRDAKLTAEYRSVGRDGAPAVVDIELLARAFGIDPELLREPRAGSTTPHNAAKHTFTHWALGIRAGRPPA